MIYQTYRPQSPLSQFVEFLWSREGNRLPQLQSRLLPIGSMELVINLNEDRFPLFDRQSRIECGSTSGTRLCGTHSEGYIIHNTSRLSIVGVHFKPGGSAALFKLPAGELHNEIISLDELWQGRSAELRERLLEASTWDDRCLILEQFLLAMLLAPRPHPAVIFALREFQQFPTPAIGKVTDQIGLSARHFNQLFRNQVGLTPKLFCRVWRLRQVLYLLNGRERVDWADIAFTCGYFDQAHFIHDFQAFAHCTPTEYLHRRGFHPCHIKLSN
jgi:AraC-like DNA-binding protein